MRKKSRKKIIILVILLLLIAMFAIFLMISSYTGKQVAEGLLYQNRGLDTRENSMMQLKAWGWDLEGFQLQYKPVEATITSVDGVEVPAFIFEGEGSNTVILVHGLGGDHVCMYPLAELYLENGWNVITYDQRGSGSSKDERVSFGYFEKRDVEALVDYARQELHSSRVAMHGQSMGAATAALYAATEHGRQYLDALVLDSCFDSMENMFLGVWRGMDTEGIPEDYVVACGDWYLKRHYGFGFEDADVMECLKEVTSATLMLQMEQDEIVSNQTAGRMFENIVASRKEICYFNSGHIEGVIDYPEEYKKAVFSFLE